MTPDGDRKLLQGSVQTFDAEVKNLPVLRLHSRLDGRRQTALASRGVSAERRYTAFQPCLLPDLLRVLSISLPHPPSPWPAGPSQTTENSRLEKFPYPATPPSAFCQTKLRALNARPGPGRCPSRVTTAAVASAVRAVHIGVARRTATSTGDSVRNLSVGGSSAGSGRSVAVVLAAR